MIDDPTDQEVHRRPHRIAVAVVLLGAWWVILLAFNLSHLPSGNDRLRVFGGYGAITLLVGFILWRFWQGRPTAWYVIVRAAFPIGAVTIVGPVWLYLFFAYSEVFDSVDEPLPIVAAVDGAVVLAGGIVARTRPARAWCFRARGRGR
jgi:hypothetical protein